MADWFVLGFVTDQGGIIEHIDLVRRLETWYRILSPDLSEDECRIDPQELETALAILVSSGRLVQQEVAERHFLVVQGIRATDAELLARPEQDTAHAPVPVRELFGRRQDNANARNEATDDERVEINEAQHRGEEEAQQEDQSGASYP